MPCQFDNLTCTKCGRVVSAGQENGKWACSADKASLGESIVGLVQTAFAHARNGFAETDKAEFDRRTAICQVCTFLTADGSCSKCRCKVAGAEGLLSKRRWQVAKCPVGRWERPRWITTAQRAKDVLLLIPQIPPDTSAIVGISRSGLAPAGLLAEALHLPLYVLDHSTIHRSGGGWRIKDRIASDGPWMIVDDTVASGRSMAQSKQLLRRIAPDQAWRFGVVYRNPASKLASEVDCYAVDLPLPHYLEWNFFNSHHMERAALDFDGILCEDADSSKAKFLPRRSKIPLIVTARLERSRERTMEWLSKHNVVVERVIMWPGTLSQRDEPGAISRYKAKHYAESGLDLFVESCPLQAKEIAGITGKPVICPEVATVF